MVEILYELLSENRKKKVVFICNVLVWDFFCLGDSGVYHSLLYYWFQGHIRKKKFSHLLLPALENVQFRAVQTFLSTLRFNVLLDHHSDFGTVLHKLFSYSNHVNLLDRHLSLSSIIWIVKRRFWRMKVVTRSTFVLVLRGTGRPNRSSHIQVFVPPKYLRTW
jgi:hypothetical protein